MNVTLTRALPWAGVLVIIGGLAAFFQYRERDKASVEAMISGVITRVEVRMDNLDKSMQSSNQTAVRMDERLRTLVDKVGDVATLLDGASRERREIWNRITGIEMQQALMLKDIDVLKGEPPKRK